MFCSLMNESFEYRSRGGETLLNNRLLLKGTLMITSEHIVPETGNRMKVFHMIFQLNDKERKEAAASARKR